MQKGLASINGASIHYETDGEGDPFLMIHAGVADSRQWNKEFDSFARTYRVIRYDLRGYGRSEPVDADFSHMRDLEALLSFLGVEAPIILMGCSMGGSLAMDFALANPSRTRALIMVGSGPSGLKLDVPTHPLDEAAERASEAGDLELLTELETQIWFDGMGRSREEVDPMARALAFEMNHLALSHEAKKLGTRHPDYSSPAADSVQHLEAPLLVIVGQHDIPYIQAASDFMQSKVPSARKVVIADAAHLPNMDHPHLFQAAVIDFLAEVLG